MSKIPAVSLALVAVVALAGCGQKTATPVAPVNTTPVTPVKVVPPLPAAKKAEMIASFKAAGKLAAEARAMRKKGEAIQNESGRVAANETLAKAKKKYLEAVSMTEEWIEPELGPFTQDQIDKFVRPFMNERSGWIKEMSKLGKVHD